MDPGLDKSGPVPAENHVVAAALFLLVKMWINDFVKAQTPRKNCVRNF